MCNEIDCDRDDALAVAPPMTPQIDAPKAQNAPKAGPSRAFRWLYRWLMQGPATVDSIVEAAAQRWGGFSEEEIRAEFDYPYFQCREQDGQTIMALIEEG